MAALRRIRRALSRGSWTESRRVAEILRQETTGGLLLILAAAIAIVWANTAGAESYFALRDTVVGPVPGECGAAGRTGQGLGMKASVSGIFIFGPARGA